MTVYLGVDSHARLQTVSYGELLRHGGWDRRQRRHSLELCPGSMRALTCAGEYEGLEEIDNGSW